MSLHHHFQSTQSFPQKQNRNDESVLYPLPHQLKQHRILYLQSVLVPKLKEFRDYLLNFKMGPVDLQYETPNILNALQIEVLKLYAKDPSADTDDLEERMMKGLNILASIPLFTFSYARNKVFKSYPYPDRSLAENILCMARGNDQYTFEEAKIMDTF